MILHCWRLHLFIFELSCNRRQYNCRLNKELNIKIQTHLERVRAVADGEVFCLALVVHPLLEHLLAEDAALGQEVMVMLEGR